MAMQKRIAIFHFIENCNSVDHFGRMHAICKVALHFHNVSLPSDTIFTEKYMQTDLKLYKVDMKYIRNLHNIILHTAFIAERKA